MCTVQHMISAVNARQYAERFVQFLSTATLFDADHDADGHDAQDLASDSAVGVGVPPSSSAPMVLVSAAPEQIEMVNQVSSTSSS